MSATQCANGATKQSTSLPEISVCQSGTNEVQSWTSRPTHMTIATVENIEAPSQAGQVAPTTTIVSNIQFKKIDLVLGIAAIIFYVIDVGLDIITGIHYIETGEIVFGMVTLGIVIFSSLSLSFVCVWAYKGDVDEKDEEVNDFHWILRFFFTLFQLGPLLRQAEYLYYAWKFTDRETGCAKEGKERFLQRRLLYNTYLTMIEATLEAAPQYILQLYILLSTLSQQNFASLAGVYRILTLTSSWVSLAMSATTVTKIARDCQPDPRARKAPMTLRHKVFVLLYRLPETGGHLLCYAVACLSGPGFGYICLMAGFIAGGYCGYSGRKYTGRFSTVFYLLIFQVYMYYFVNFVGTRSRLRNMMHAFTLSLVKPLALYFLVKLEYTDTSSPFFLAIAAILGGLFLIHVFLLVVYNLIFHPSSSNIKICACEDPRESFCQGHH